MKKPILISAKVAGSYIGAYDYVMGLGQTNSFINLAQKKFPNEELYSAFQSIITKDGNVESIAINWLVEFWNALCIVFPSEKHMINLSRQIGRAWWQGGSPLNRSYWNYPCLHTLVSDKVLEAISTSIFAVTPGKSRVVALNVSLTSLAQFFRDHFHCNIDVQVIDDKHVMFHVINTPLTLDNDPNFRMFWGVLDGFCLWLSSPHYKNPIIQVDEELSTFNKIIIRYGKKDNKS